MLEIKENVDLLPYNTFHIQAFARYFVTITSQSQAQQLLQSSIARNNPLLILGGGSNILFTKNFPGLVIKNEIKGVEVLRQDADLVMLKVGSGEPWHDLVRYCVDRDFGGIENLSLIPGTCGAAPMQNIGAYGVEIKEVIHNVEAVDIETGAIKIFSNEACRFGYRESVFKQEAKGKHFISSITLTLTRCSHKFNTSYGAIREVLGERKIQEPTVKAISEAVIHIRQSKLPDPKVIGNAGSFFKNPSIDRAHFESLTNDFPSVPSFPGEDNRIKIPAGWLIEQAGWKGKTFENIGVHKLQALVLVNYGGADGQKILELAKDIQRSVRDKFQIDLHPEVNII